MSEDLLFTLVGDAGLTVNLINIHVDKIDLGEAVKFIASVDWQHAVQHTVGGFLPIASDGQQAFTSVSSTATIGPIG